MSEFDHLEKKAQAFVEEHPDQADQRIDEAVGFTEHDPDYQRDEQIDQAMDTVEQHTRHGHDQQGNQDDQEARGNQG